VGFFIHPDAKHFRKLRFFLAAGGLEDAGRLRFLLAAGGLEDESTIGS
jgi:hypothetical protein